MKPGTQIHVHLGVLTLKTILNTKPKMYIFSYKSNTDKRYDKDRIEIIESQIQPIKNLIK